MKQTDYSYPLSRRPSVRGFVFTLTAVLVLAAPPGCAARQTACVASTIDTFDRCLESKISGLIEAGFPGFAVVVFTDKGLVHERYFGVADRSTGRVPTSETLFQIGSVTKMFTGLLFARMVGEGLVEAGDPIADYLPDGVVVPSDSSDSVITLLHLATHTSGLPRYPANLDRVDGDPMTGYSVEELYAGLSAAELVHPVGSNWLYSNFGYGLLGHLLERAAGESLEALLRRFVLVTPGLNEITFEPGPFAVNRLATPYRDENTRVATSPWDMGTLSGAGAIFASPRSLAKFGGLLLGEGGNTRDESMAAAIRYSRAPYHRFRSPGNSNRAYGIGQFIVDDWQGAGFTAYWHGGDLDGYAASLLVAPSEGIGVLFLTNSSIGPALAQSGLNGWLLPSAVEAFGARD